MNHIDNAIVLEEAKRYTDSKQLAKVVIEKKELISYSDLPLEYDNAEGYVSYTFSPAPFIPSIGKTYEVVWNGGAYKAICKDVSETVGVPIALIIGNTVTTGGDDTGEPFVLVYMDDGEINGFEVLAVGATADVFVDLTVSEFAETIHPIDPKFLPGVCLPVVEFSTIPVYGSQTELTAEESAQMEEVLTMGVPFVGKLNLDEGVSANGFFNCINYSDTHQYVCETLYTVVAKVNNVWAIISTQE